jgi:hypothetical protein
MNLDLQLQQAADEVRAAAQRVVPREVATMSTRVRNRRVASALSTVALLVVVFAVVRWANVGGADPSISPADNTTTTIEQEALEAVEPSMRWRFLGEDWNDAELTACVLAGPDTEARGTDATGNEITWAGGSLSVEGPAGVWGTVNWERLPVEPDDLQFHTASFTVERTDEAGEGRIDVEVYCPENEWTATAGG